MGLEDMFAGLFVPKMFFVEFLGACCCLKNATKDLDSFGAET